MDIYNQNFESPQFVTSVQSLCHVKEGSDRELVQVYVFNVDDVGNCFDLTGDECVLLCISQKTVYNIKEVVHLCVAFIDSFP